MYDYQKGKENILKIVNSETDANSGFENGVRSWISSIFIDIVDSTRLFKNYGDQTVAKIIRIFCSEITEILKQTELEGQVGVRGDCVFAVFLTPTKDDVDQVFNLAVEINTLSGLINRLFANSGFPRIEYGIGLGCSEDLVVKVGKKEEKDDLIFVGDAVLNASNLSKKAHRGSIREIAMDGCFYHNIVNLEKQENSDFENWIKMEYLKNTFYNASNDIDFYHCNVVKTGFSNWLKEGMPKE